MNDVSIEIDNLKEHIKQLEQLIRQDAELLRGLVDALNRELDYRIKGR